MNIYDGFLFTIGAILATVFVVALVWVMMTTIGAKLERSKAMTPKRIKKLLARLEQDGMYEDASFLNRCIQSHNKSGKWPKELAPRLDVKSTTIVYFKKSGAIGMRTTVKINLKEATI